MTFCCEIELDGVKYKCEYSRRNDRVLFYPTPSTDKERQLILAVYDLFNDRGNHKDCWWYKDDYGHESTWHVYGTEAKSWDIF